MEDMEETSVNCRHVFFLYKGRSGPEWWQRAWGMTKVWRIFLPLWSSTLSLQMTYVPFTA